MSFFKRDEFLWFLLIVLPPIGLILLWRRKRDRYTASKLMALSSIFFVWFCSIVLFIIMETGDPYHRIPYAPALESTLTKTHDTSLDLIKKDSPVIIAHCDAKSKTISIQNHSHHPMDLANWALISTMNNECYTFPSIVIPSGKVIVVSGGDTEGEIRWDVEGIWSSEFALYDANGTLVSRYP